VRGAVAGKVSGSWGGVRSGIVTYGTGINSRPPFISMSSCEGRSDVHMFGTSFGISVFSYLS